VVRVGPGLLLGLLLAASPTNAGALEGEGRVSVQTGWRVTPNNTFYESAAAAGFSAAGSSPGGPVLQGSFGYSAAEWVEATIDLFAGGEMLRLVNQAALLSVTYGAAAGARLQWAFDAWGPFREVVPYAGLLLGPTLINVTGGNLPAPREHVVTGYIGSAGVSARLADGWGLSLEYRFLVARGQVPGIGSLNGGGSWLGVGVTWYFAPEQRMGEAGLPRPLARR
jgi:hypothetical protein